MLKASRYNLRGPKFQRFSALRTENWPLNGGVSLIARLENGLERRNGLWNFCVKQIVPFQAFFCPFPLCQAIEESPLLPVRLLGTYSTCLLKHIKYVHDL